MIIKSVSFSHFGPFAEPSEIQVDKNLTVITGANDSGKSKIIRGLEVLLTDSKLTEDDANDDRIGEFENGWDKTNIITAEITVELTNGGIQGGYIEGSGKPGDILTTNYNLHDEQQRRKIREVLAHSNTGGPSRKEQRNVIISRLPSLHIIDPSDSLRRQFPIDGCSRTERKLLDIAFGQGFSKATIDSISNETRRQKQIAGAGLRLTNAFKKYLPKGLGFEFHFNQLKDGSLSVAIKDSQECLVELPFRGTGLQRLLSIFCQLVYAQNHSKGKDYKVIAIDEPELHLHSDAQKQLRRVLEDISKDERIQVIYVTHSACFINAANTPSIRLVSRTTKNDYPTSHVENIVDLPEARRELGVTISESLALGSVTLIVEGVTEYPTLMRLCSLLSNAENSYQIKASDVHDVFSQVTLMNGHGDNIIYYARIVSNFGVMPVILLDGDKGALSSRIENELPNSALYTLPKNTEYEDILPFEAYLRQSIAMSISRDGSDTRPTPDDYFKWLEDKPNAQNQLTSKKVDYFLYEQSLQPAPKRSVFEAVLSEIEAEEELPDNCKTDLIANIFKVIKNAVANAT